MTSLCIVIRNQSIVECNTVCGIKYYYLYQEGEDKKGVNKVVSYFVENAKYMGFPIPESRGSPFV